MSWQIWFVYGLVALAVLLFFSGRVRLDLTAALVIIALAVSGILTPAEAVSGFGNPLVMLIAGLFIVSEGLARTGVASAVGVKIAALGGRSERRLILLLVPVVAVLSAVMSSTGVVALFVPVVLTLAREAGLAPARLLMPLAIAALIGGMLTLIGTPPNLVVNRALIDAGRDGFAFFDFTLIGGCILLLAIGFLLTLGMHLLPQRTSAPSDDRHRRLHEFAEHYGIGDQLRSLRIQAESALVGKTVGEAAMRREHGLTVIALQRGRWLSSLNPVLVNTRLQADDVLIVVGRPETIATQTTDLRLSDQGFPHGLQRRYRESFGAAETLVVPGSPLVGKTLAQANLRARQRINVLAMRRADKPLEIDFQDTQLQSGDLLLVAGSWSDLERLTGPRTDMVLLQMPAELADRTWHANQAPWAVLITLLMLFAMATQVTSNLVAVMLAAFFMVVTRCVEMNEAYRSMNWQSLVLIAGMLPLADALAKTGGADQIVNGLSALFAGHGVYVILVGLFLLTSLLSQFISNTATTVLIAPIALNLALGLGYSPQAFMMTVAIAASTAFATPVASPVNILVLAPGQYRFSDFVKVGVPLQMLALAVTVLLVPLVFPLTRT
ncbi:MAG: sodium-coupled transporter [Gammaproteobacteria bacterium]|nr:sodium-coupled transporter [Gammaproteobacteria bacterium]